MLIKIKNWEIRAELICILWSVTMDLCTRWVLHTELENKAIVPPFSLVSLDLGNAASGRGRLFSLKELSLHLGV